jgi:SET domain-containing protein
MHGHIIFFALRDIAPGEEITLDYVESYHPNDKRCDCGAPKCRGTINLIKG